MHRAAPVFIIEAYFDDDAVTDAGIGCLAYRFVQIQIERAIPDGHKVYSPWLMGPPVDAHQDGKRSTPIRLEAPGCLGVNTNKWIDPANADDGFKGYATLASA